MKDEGQREAQRTGARSSACLQPTGRARDATRRCACTSRMRRPRSRETRRPPAGAPYSRCTARRRRRRRRRRHPARPPPRARQPPSGRPRPRKTRLLGSAKPHTGRAALSTGNSANLTPPSANGRGGRVQPPSVSTVARPAPGRARGHRRADGRARGGCALPRAGAPFGPGGPQDCRGRQGEENSHPFRSGAPFSPHPHASRSTLAAQLLPLPLPPPPPKLAPPPPLPPWLGAVT